MASGLDGAESDYVVVGGGTAGCILAARLSEDPGTTVTLLEAGPEDRDIWIHIPAGYARMFVHGRYDWKYATEPEAALNDRAVNWPRGKVLGGSGSINGMVFLRGSPLDYDRWAQAGARGWAYADVMPYFRKLEDWQGPPGETRGRGGPVPVCETPKVSAGAEAFIAACQATGLPFHRDVNDGPIEGVAKMQGNLRRGRRVSTARAYLRPARGRQNLRVVTGALARRVVVENGRATGVVVRRGEADTVFPARRGVVLTAGAVATPQLLMLSGIGDASALSALGIPVVADRREVGRNLQDHMIVRLAFRTRPARTLNEIQGYPFRMLRAGIDYALTGQGPLSIGASEAVAFAKVTPGAEEAEAQFQFMNFALKPGTYELQPHPGMTINVNQCRPDSRGELTLRSADPADKPVIRANYLDAPADRRAVIEGLRFGHRIAQAAPFARLVEEQLSPPPGRSSEDELLDFVRRTGSSVYHPCGTCRMGSDDGAVVDTSLRVRGVEGLVVADASVMPLVPSTNIQPAVMMIAERAAEMIRRAS